MSEKKSGSYSVFEAKGEFRPWEFELNALGPKDVEIKITHSGMVYCI